MAGNYVGVDPTGTFAIPNGGVGVEIQDGTGNTIGGLTSTPGTGAGNVISGNAGTGISDSGGSNLIAGNLIGLAAGGTVALGNSTYGIVVYAGGDTIGGTSAGAGNVISGNDAGGLTLVAGSSLIEGNLIGTTATGDVALGNQGVGVYLLSGTSGTTIGGTVSGAGNVISGNYLYGVDLNDTSNILIAGNNIGTDITGTLRLGNGKPEMLIGGGTSDVTVGGTTALAGNVISGGGEGILIQGTATTGNLVEGNEIGTDRSGTIAVGSVGFGIFIGDNSSDNTIGGTAAGAGNIIAYCGGDGVVVGYGAGDNATGNAILTNEIYANSGLGINLGDEGVVVLNDSSGHTGPNLFQDFPVITSAVTTGGMTTLDGTITETPDTTYLLQFFSNPAADPSGYGQGQTYLTSEDVMTDSMGVGTFSVPAPSEIAPVITRRRRPRILWAILRSSRQTRSWLKAILSLG